MTFKQWWDQLTPKEQQILGKNNAEFVWKQSRRNALEDIARQIEQMPFGNTSHSFAVWIRDQINDKSV
jgi:hypothetical protein